MFEQESAHYALENVPPSLYKIVDIAFHKGAEFGYNKANEWYKVSDKLPEMNVPVYLWSKAEKFPMIACRHKESDKIDWYWDYNQGENFMSRLFSIDNGYLWKEITLPEPPKELEI